MNKTKEIMKQQRVCVMVPTYNNAGTVVDVVKGILQLTDDLIVVIDGCTDDTRERLDEAGLDIVRVDYPQNRGKGHALLAGFEKALAMDYDYAITIDADGQHLPEDIPVFLEALQQHPDSLIIGARNLHQENMSSGSTFANKFSNFWFKLQTGIALSDTQTGYRLYPLRRLTGKRFITSRYEAELELLVFSAWANIPIHEVPVNVYYPPKEERVSHFRPFADFLRISILNTVLCFLAVVYGWPRRIIHQLTHHGKTL
jgi:glycosyltransferase involved in cell wall biosynthesis